MKFLRFQLSLGICTYYFNMENIINAKLDLICLNFFKFLCQHIIFFFLLAQRKWHFWVDPEVCFAFKFRFTHPPGVPPPLSIIRTPLDYFFNQMWEVL